MFGIEIISHFIRPLTLTLRLFGNMLADHAVLTAFMGLAVAGFQAALIVGGLKVDFDRYYLPIVFVFAIGVGGLASTMVSVIFRFAVRFGAPELPRQKLISMSAD